MIAQNIRELRRDKNITQEDLAERSGLSVGAIKQIETGKRWPRPETLDALAKGLGVPQFVLLSNYKEAKQTAQNEKYPRLELILKIIQTLPSASEGDLKDVLDLLESRASRATSKPKHKA